MIVEVPQLDPEEILGHKSGEKLHHKGEDESVILQENSISGENSIEGNNIALRQKVLTAREIQRRRFRKFGFSLNSEIPPKLHKKFLSLDPECEDLMKNAVVKFHLSARATFRIIKTARTIADMAGSEKIQKKHILEALNMRKAERFFNLPHEELWYS